MLMQRFKRVRPAAFGQMFCLLALFATAPPAVFCAQPRTPVKVTTEPVAPEPDRGATQEKLLSLLRVSPTLAQVVASDPSLLADRDYVTRTNPELAQFLEQHPEVTRNPGYYLFSELQGPGQRHYEVMRPREGFEHQWHDDRSASIQVINQLAPIFALIAFLVGSVWLIRILLENRRWTKVFGLQSQVHGKLIEKFGSSQELMAYMETDAGKRFLEAAPIATESDQKRMPNAASRVLMTTQIGIVLTLLGAGLLMLRNHVGDAQTAMLVLGTVVLMPGIGFIISAAMTWVLAKRLGLMPSATTETFPLERL